MAPRFKQTMYQTYKKGTATDAVVCFSLIWGILDTKIDPIFSFRDKLVEEVLETSNLFINKYEGKPTKVDSWFMFFSSPENKKTAVEFFNKKLPGLFDIIFKTKKEKEYENERQKIRQLAVLEIETSHDHPCIEIHSSIHSEELLSTLIETTAKELNINMFKNSNLPAVKDVILTNKTFST